MSQKLPLIAFLVGLLLGDLSYRLFQPWTFQVMLVTALAASAILYLLSGTHELVRDAALPLVGGFAASGAIKVVFATMLS